MNGIQFQTSGQFRMGKKVRLRTITFYRTTTTAAGTAWFAAQADPSSFTLPPGLVVVAFASQPVMGYLAYVEIGATVDTFAHSFELDQVVDGNQILQLSLGTDFGAFLQWSDR